MDMVPEQILSPLAEDVAVWRRSTELIREHLVSSPHVHPFFKARVPDLLGLDAPPTLAFLNTWLSPLKWQVAPVDGYVAVDVYQSMLADRVFPVARGSRSLQNIAYSPVPDFIHDVLGHLPMLFVPQYSQLIFEWARLAGGAAPSAHDAEAFAALVRLGLAEADGASDHDVHGLRRHLQAAQRKAAETPTRYFLFQTFYAIAIEFGLVRPTASELQVIGAATLSSRSEFQRVVSQRVNLGRLNAACLLTALDDTAWQQAMYYVSSFADYERILGTI